MIAIDTGIRRTVDARLRAWIDDALKRASGKFTMAILGHPKFAAGVQIPVHRGQSFRRIADRVPVIADSF